MILPVKCPDCGVIYKLVIGQDAFSCVGESCEKLIRVNWDTMPEYLFVEESKADAMGAHVPPVGVRPPPAPPAIIVLRPPPPQRQTKAPPTPVKRIPRIRPLSPPPRNKPFGLVGTELKKLIPKMLEHTGCGCTAYAHQMDAWGVAGCRQRFDEIVEHLVGQATKASHGVLPEFASRKVAKTWVRKAIDNADAEHLVIAVTSLSPNPARVERQQKCLASWKEFGLTSYVVNTAEEIAQLRPLFPTVDHWVEENNTTTRYDRPCQLIYRLAQVAVEIGQPILLINSDIEIYGEQIPIPDARALIVGIRHNYENDICLAEPERWGFDAFVITPEMAATLPEDMPTAIGQPFHDYLTVIHFQSLGYTLDFWGDPLFYHENHEVQWDHSSQHIGSDWARHRYGYDGDNLRWRNALPFPPNNVRAQSQ